MSINNRLDQARKAFEKKDLSASEATHSREVIAEP